MVLARASQLFARLFGLTLSVPHAGIKAVLGEQRIVGAALDDLAMVKHDDLVGADDGREPVRDHQRRAVAGNALERVLDFLFGMAVERGCRLIEHQNWRTLQDGAGDRDTLLFAAREFQSALADLGLVALRRNPDQRVDLRKASRLFDLGISRLPAAIANVVADRVVEQHGVLRNHADHLPQRFLRHLARCPGHRS